MKMSIMQKFKGNNEEINDYTIQKLLQQWQLKALGKIL